VRSGRKNRSASSESNHGKTNNRKTWIQRTKNCRTTWAIPIRGQQICWKRKREPPRNRGLSGDFSVNKPNGNFTRKRAQQQNRNPQPLLPNLRSHTTKRFDVSILPKRNDPIMGRKLSVLSLMMPTNLIKSKSLLILRKTICRMMKTQFWTRLQK